MTCRCDADKNQVVTFHPVVKKNVFLLIFPSPPSWRSKSLARMNRKKKISTGVLIRLQQTKGEEVMNCILHCAPEGSSEDHLAWNSIYYLINVTLNHQRLGDDWWPGVISLSSFRWSPPSPVCNRALVDSLYKSLVCWKVWGGFMERFAVTLCNDYL